MNRRLNDVHLLKELKGKSLRLDPDAAAGSYAIDGLLLEMRKRGFPKTPLPNNLDILLVRDIVSSAGAAAVALALEQAEAPIRYEHVKDLYKWLEDFAADSRRGAKRFRATKVSSFIEHSGRIDDIDEHDRASLNADAYAFALVEKIDHLATEVKQFLGSNKIAHRGGSPEEWLTNNFMKMMAIAWSGAAGYWLHANQRSFFRRMLVAGWSDLKLPDPLDRKGQKKPVEDHFRDRLTAQAFAELSNELPARVVNLARHFGAPIVLPKSPPENT